MKFKVKQEAVIAFGPQRVQPGNTIDLPEEIGMSLVQYHILELIEEPKPEIVINSVEVEQVQHEAPAPKRRTRSQK